MGFFDWFKDRNTTENYSDERIAADHEDSLNEFASTQPSFVRADPSEQVVEAEATLDESLVDDEG